MVNQFQETMMTIKQLEEYSLILHKKDLYLEQIELLLYRMEYLAQKAILENETVKRQELQNEVEAIKVEIDKIAVLYDNG